ncbi:hypothetical protein D7252_17095 [Microbacterium sp. CGR2]|nr:hypothetical protein D7252_17095 [Microbacterium sp. CGR2]
MQHFGVLVVEGAKDRRSHNSMLDTRIELVRWKVRDAHAVAMQQVISFDSRVIVLTKAAQHA